MVPEQCVLVIFKDISKLINVTCHWCRLDTCNPFYTKEVEGGEEGKRN